MLSQDHHSLLYIKHQHNLKVDKSTIRRMFFVTEGDEMIIAGMVVLEKFPNSYIQYVDTTGLSSKRLEQSSITKWLIRDYIVKAFDRGITLIYTFADAKDEILFKGSSENEQKRPLPPLKLINWWIRCLEYFTDVYVWSPYEERIQSKRIAKRIESIPGWKYKKPFKADEHFTVLPIFPTQDDPKWQHYKCMRQSGKDYKAMTVADFWETIQLRDEFQKSQNSFFAIKKDTCEYQDTFFKKDEQDESKQDSNLDLLAMLRSMTWTCIESASENTKIILQHLSKDSNYTFTIIHLDSTFEGSLCENKENITSSFTNIQSLLKRKK